MIIFKKVDSWQQEMEMSIMMNKMQIAELMEVNNRMTEKIASLEKNISSGGWKVCGCYDIFPPNNFHV